MTTDGHASENFSHDPDAFADAWAAVFIDLFEQLRDRGELPDDELSQSVKSISRHYGERLHAVTSVTHGAI